MREPDEVAGPGDDALGEGPAWDPATHSLSWVDIRRRRVHSWAGGPAEVTTRTLPREVSLALPAADGARVVTQVDTVCRDDGERLRPLTTVAGADDGTRLNDGVCDAFGGLWVGSYSTLGRADATLTRIAPDGSQVRALDGLVAVNGLGWLDAGATMLVTDTGRSRIDAYPVLDLAGARLGCPLTFATFEGPGRPDGLAVDAADGVWVAIWGGGRIHRYAADRRLDYVLQVPVSFPTSVAFGGVDLGVLYVTTSRCHLPDPADRNLEPLAGSVLGYRLGVAGRAAYLFGAVGSSSR
jgi:sugar lactone lactonase YvrE